MDKKQRNSSLILLLTSLIWGTAFVAQGAVSKVLGPFTFNAVRTLVGALVMYIIYLALRKTKALESICGGDKPTVSINLIGGAVCGFFMFLGSGFQQLGITQYSIIYGTTAVGKAGFITALYVIFVPLLGLFIKKRPSFVLWISVAVSVGGMYLLCVKDGFSVDIPDLWVLLGAFSFGFYILFVDYYASKVNILLFSTFQLLSCSLFSFAVAFITERLVLTDIISQWFPILYAGILSSAVAYTLEAIAQKHVNPTLASLIFCLESVFAALSGWLLLNESMTLKEILGCALVFVAVLIAQLPTRGKAANHG